MNAPTPITFITLDEVERKFRLTNKRALAIRQRSVQGFTHGDIDFLWFCCDDTDGFTEDDFAELFPLHDTELLQGLVTAITDEWKGRTKASAANDKFRPTKAEIQPSTGSGSSPSSA